MEHGMEWNGKWTILEHGMEQLIWNGNHEQMHRAWNGNLEQLHGTWNGNTTSGTWNGNLEKIDVYTEPGTELQCVPGVHARYIWNGSLEHMHGTWNGNTTLCSN